MKSVKRRRVELSVAREDCKVTLDRTDVMNACEAEADGKDEGKSREIELKLEFKHARTLGMESLMTKQNLEIQGCTKLRSVSARFPGTYRLPPIP